MKAYIVTGAPGTGKTTLINRLSENGYSGLPEIPRILIKEGIAEKMGISPFKDLQGFFELVFSEMQKQYQSVLQSNKTYFFDRGIPDVLGYAYRYNIKLPLYIIEAIKAAGFEQDVFFCPTWSKIYTKDSERPYNYTDTKQLEDNLHKAYTELGYKINVMPKVSVEQRLEYIKDIICTKN